MAGSGLCCGSLEEPKILMKMGLCMVFIGHINFLLAALVHGVVLRHIALSAAKSTALEVVITNVVALVTGLVGIVVGVLAIILSRNKKSRSLTWSVFTVSLVAAIMAAASAIGLLVSVAMAIVQNGQNLLMYCRYPTAIGYTGVNNECPFDPTRINSTTLILWIPLIVICVTQTVFCSRCSAVCLSFLGLSGCCNRNRHRHYGKTMRTPINVVRPLEEGVTSCYIEPSRSHPEPLKHCAEPQRRCNTAPPRQQHRPPSHLPQHPPRHHHHQSLPPSERRPLHQPHRERSHRQRQEMRPGSQQSAPERRHLLERGTLERSSVWI